jgi:hypothetical protein
MNQRQSNNAQFEMMEVDELELDIDDDRAVMPMNLNHHRQNKSNSEVDQCSKHSNIQNGHYSIIVLGILPAH